MTPQAHAVFEALKRRGTLTPMEALRDLSCMRLAARVHEIREAGHRIGARKVERRNRAGEVVRVCEYSYHSKRAA